MTGFLIRKLQETLSQELTAIDQNNIPGGLSTAGYYELFKRLIDVGDFTPKEVEMLRESLEVRGNALFYLEKDWLAGEKKVRFRGFQSSHLSAMHQRTIKIEALANTLCPLIYAYSTLYNLFEEEKSLLMPVEWKTGYIDQAAAVLARINNLDMRDSSEWTRLCEDFSRIVHERQQAIEDYTNNLTPPAIPFDQSIDMQESWLESMERNSRLLLQTWDDMQYVYPRIQDFLDESQHAFPDDSNDFDGKAFDSVRMLPAETAVPSISQRFFTPPKTPRLQIEYYYDRSKSGEITSSP